MQPMNIETPVKVKNHPLSHCLDKELNKFEKEKENNSNKSYENKGKKKREETTPMVKNRFHSMRDNSEKRKSFLFFSSKKKNGTGNKMKKETDFNLFNYPIKAQLSWQVANGVTETEGLPVIVFQAVKFLEEHLDEQGIFRISGNQAMISFLYEQYSLGDTSGIVDVPDCHVICGILKCYVRNIKDNLVSDEVQNKLIELTENGYEGNKDEIIKIFTQIPRENYLILKKICYLLYKISINAEKNKMNSNNLATVWAPNFFKSSDSQVDPNVLMNMATKSSFAMLTIIDNTPELFSEADLLIPSNDDYNQSFVFEDELDIGKRDDYDDEIPSFKKSIKSLSKKFKKKRK